ncbi:hypothetical protein HPB50_014568 [Hyalomma asiaticum]|uniref:Uncharacterized protein n=1 Tax=Hyalomma asiaticum TaxID=266040 RepID=A0ACB7S9S0_HYAAI|nr:hypothetical protein HPB50_014568 [Hyalomma asiaticum]
MPQLTVWLMLAELVSPNPLAGVSVLIRRRREESEESTEAAARARGEERWRGEEDGGSCALSRSWRGEEDRASSAIAKGYNGREQTNALCRASSFGSPAFLSLCGGDSEYGGGKTLPLCICQEGARLCLFDASTVFPAPPLR